MSKCIGKSHFEQSYRRRTEPLFFLIRQTAVLLVAFQTFWKRLSTGQTDLQRETACEVARSGWSHEASDFVAAVKSSKLRQ